MSATTLRGLAVLTLLCLVPRASALTITQTATLNYSGSIGTPKPIGIASWGIQLFSSGHGKLESVELTGHITSTLVDSIINPAPAPLTLPRTLHLESLVTLPDQTWFTGQKSSVSLPPVLLQPGELHYYQGSMIQDLSVTLTSPSDLILFIGTGNKTLFVGGIGESLNFGGMPGFSSVASMSITYNYSAYSVADTSSPFAIAVVAGLCLSLFHRRISRSRPGA